MSQDEEFIVALLYKHNLFTHFKLDARLITITFVCALYTGNKCINKTSVLRRCLLFLSTFDNDQLHCVYIIIV
jgi:hypothetical protein